MSRKKKTVKDIIILPMHKPGVYAIHNKKTDKYYIGSTNDLHNRTHLHRTNIYNNGGVNMRMLEDIQSKKDVFNFEFLALEVFENNTITEGELRKREGYFIKLYQSDVSGYNDKSHPPLSSPARKDKLVSGNKRVTRIKENYDKVLTRFPKGTKERILNTGAESINAFIIQAVNADLDRIESHNKSKVYLTKSGSIEAEQLPFPEVEQ